MTAEQAVVAAYAGLLAKQIIPAVIADLQALTENLQSGDDSGLTNIWEELCVQVQGEESVDFELYVDIVDDAIEASLKKIGKSEVLALWLSTEEGWDWACDHHNAPSGETDAPVSS